MKNEEKQYDTILFVYGTLHKKQPNHKRFLSDAVYLGEAETKRKYELYDVGGFPGMLRGGRNRVVGELYAVDDDTLKTIDRLEGVPHMYRREKIRLRRRSEVFGYIYQYKPKYDTHIEEIPSGDWAEYVRHGR